MSERKASVFGNKTRLWLIIGGLFVGVLLILWGSIYTDNGSADDTETSGKDIYYSKMLEQKIEDFLSTVGGIRSVSVFVTIDGGTEYKYAQKGGEGYASDYLIINRGDGEEAAVVKEIYPSIRGVGVTCTDGNNAAVKQEIVSLLSAALGIPANKIEVVGKD